MANPATTRTMAVERKVELRLAIEWWGGYQNGTGFLVRVYPNLGFVNNGVEKDALRQEAEREVIRWVSSLVSVPEKNFSVIDWEIGPSLRIMCLDKVKVIDLRN